MNLTLTDDHHYIDMDTGNEYPGVTTVIKAAGLMGYMPGDQWYLDRGEAVHLATALYDKGLLDETTVDPQIAGYLEAWKRFRDDTGHSPLFVEKSLFHPLYHYCGTLDRDGLDLKAGAACSWHLAQAGSYYELQKAANIALPSLWRTVYLQEDGGYKIQAYNIHQLREGFGVFRAALTIQTWRKNNNVK